jgi:hypothetical protein
MDLNSLWQYLEQAINAKCAKNFYMEIVYAADIKIFRTLSVDQ